MTVRILMIPTVYLTVHSLVDTRIMFEGLRSDLSSVMDCFSSPSSSPCLAVWGDVTQLPGVLTGKCDQADCDLLPPLTSCMSDPSGASCTGE